MSTQEATLTLTLFAAMATLQLASSHRAAARAPANLDLPPVIARDPGMRAGPGLTFSLGEVVEGLAAAGALQDPEAAAVAAFNDLLLTQQH